MQSLEKPPSASRYKSASLLGSAISSLHLDFIVLFFLCVIPFSGLFFYIKLDLYRQKVIYTQLMTALKLNNSWLLGIVAVALALVGNTLLFSLMKRLNKAMQQQAAGNRLWALQDSEQQYRNLFESNPQPMWVYDVETLKILAVNNVAIRYYGYSRDEFLTKTTKDIISPEDVSVILDGVFQHRKKDGTIIDLEIATYSLEFSGRSARVVLANDISERRRAEEALRESDRRYHILAKVSPVGIFHTNAEGRCIYVNERWCEMSGITVEQAMGEGWLQAIHPEDRDRVFLQWLLATKEILPFQSEYRLPKSSKEETWVFGQALAEKTAYGEVLGYIGTLTDITKHKQAEEQIQKYAFYDTQTGLPKRTYFLERLAHLLKPCKREEVGLFAVLFLDLDRFQIVKYSLGHLVADELVATVAYRLKACLGATDIAARVGSDEFAILLSNLCNVSDATRIADKIYQQLSLPFNLHGREVFVTVSIGIAIGAYGSDDLPENCLRAADTAMHHAKKQGNLPYAVFEPAMHARALARLQLDTDLRRAIERQELQVYYQPIVSISTGRITGFEALVRWQHPQRGFLSPAEFIPVAEETGLIISIGNWVLTEACRQLHVWQQINPVTCTLTMSVNVSTVQFKQPGLIEQIDRVIQETGIDPSCLKLEITESVVMENPDAVTTVLEQLRARNICLAIDDFGTGYCSLSYLHRFPIDTLKIDRSFVSRMGIEGENTAIVKTIATLAHQLGMDIVAEGVETPEQLAQLAALKCQYGQGYYFARPVDSTAALKLITTE